MLVCDWLTFPLSSSWVGEVDDLTAGRGLWGEEYKVEFRTNSEEGLERETELLDDDSSSFWVFGFDGLSLVTVLIDGLIIGSKVYVLYVVRPFPVIVL